MSAAIPIIETPRLILRGHSLADFEIAADMWGDPRITRYIARPFTREECWARLMRYVGHWTLLGYGFWAITEKASGAFIGEGGFADFRRDMAWPAGISAAESAHETGWVLAGPHHGKGYASEAMLAATNWADAHFNCRTLCIIDPENAPSLSVAARCGFAPAGTAEYKESQVTVFARERGAGA